MTAPVRRRPIGVTFIGILGVLMGLFHIMAGILVIVDRDDVRLIKDSGMSPDQLLASGILIGMIGFAVFFLSLGLMGGSSLARFVFAFFVVLQVAGGVYALVAFNGEQQASGAVSLVVGLFVLFLLYGTEADRDFFVD